MSYTGIREGYESLQTRHVSAVAAIALCQAQTRVDLTTLVEGCGFFCSQFDQTFADRDELARDLRGGANVPQYDLAARPERTFARRQISGEYKGLGLALTQPASPR